MRKTISLHRTSLKFNREARCHHYEPQNLPFHTILTPQVWPEDLGEQIAGMCATLLGKAKSSEDNLNGDGQLTLKTTAHTQHSTMQQPQMINRFEYGKICRKS